MIAIVKGIIETLNVANEHFAFPLRCGVRRVCIMVEQESELHATGVQKALVALSCHVLTCCVTENGEGQDGRANGVETGALLTGQGLYAGCEQLHIRITHAL